MNKQAQGVTEADADKLVDDLIKFARKRYPGIWASKKIEYQPFAKKITLDFSILISDNKA